MVDPSLQYVAKFECAVEVVYLLLVLTVANEVSGELYWAKVRRHYLEEVVLRAGSLVAWTAG